MSSSLHDGTAPAAALTTPFAPTASGCSLIEGDYTNPGCMPPGFTQYWDGSVGYYSPAICPLSWTPAKTAPRGFGPTVEREETAMICCPSYDLSEELVGKAVNFSRSYEYNPKPSYSNSEYISYCGSFTRTLGTTWATTTNMRGSSTRYLVSTLGEKTKVSACAIQIRWASSDLTKFATNPTIYGQSIPQSTVAPISSTATQVQSKYTTNRTETRHSDGLSLGGKVGIGLGVPLFLVILGVLIFLVARSCTQAPKERVKHTALPKNSMADLSGDYQHHRDPSLPQHTAMATPALERTLNDRDEIQYQRALSISGQSTMAPEVISDGQDMEQMKQERERLRVRKSRLLELTKIEEEEHRLKNAIRSRASLVRPSTADTTHL